jgi:hypothetical protein
MTLSIKMPCSYAECHYADCRILFNIKLNVIMLSVVMLGKAVDLFVKATCFVIKSIIFSV